MFLQGTLISLTKELAVRSRHAPASVSKTDLEKAQRKIPLLFGQLQGLCICISSSTKPAFISFVYINFVLNL